MIKERILFKARTKHSSSNDHDGSCRNPKLLKHILIKKFASAMSGGFILSSSTDAAEVLVDKALNCLQREQSTTWGWSNINWLNKKNSKINQTVGLW